MFLGPGLASAEESWQGWITDESCGAKGANRGHAACAKKCRDGGARLVLYSSADGRLYKLDDQEAAGANVGREVEVRGALSGDTIRVTAITEAGR